MEGAHEKPSLFFGGAPGPGRGPTVEQNGELETCELVFCRNNMCQTARLPGYIRLHHDRASPKVLNPNHLNWLMTLHFDRQFRLASIKSR